MQKLLQTLAETSEHQRGSDSIVSCFPLRNEGVMKMPTQFAPRGSDTSHRVMEDALYRTQFSCHSMFRVATNVLRGSSSLS